MSIFVLSVSWKEELGNGSDYVPILRFVAYNGGFYPTYDGRVQFAVQVIFLFILSRFLFNEKRVRQATK